MAAIATGLGIRSGGGAAMTGTRPVIDFMVVGFLNDAFGETVKRVQR